MDSERAVKWVQVFLWAQAGRALRGRLGQHTGNVAGTELRGAGARDGLGLARAAGRARMYELTANSLLVNNSETATPRRISVASTSPGTKSARVR